MQRRSSNTFTYGHNDTHAYTYAFVTYAYTYACFAYTCVTFTFTLRHKQ